MIDLGVMLMLSNVFVFSLSDLFLISQMFKGPAKPKGPAAHLTQMFGASLLDATAKSVDTASVIQSSSENFLRFFPPILPQDEALDMG
jgi:hypothetical protein